MATKSKKAAPAKTRPARKAPRTSEAPVRAPHSEAYDAALESYGEALGMLRKGDYSGALERFRKVESANRDEQELADRARTYAALCARKLAPPDRAPQSAEERYYLGVLRANEGRFDEAAALLDQALAAEPSSPRVLYARASLRALQGRTDGAVADLRAAIAGEPLLRHQAANDPDYERIRNEAAFIDVIEPSHAGA
jgi:tetratricopeptide (TPR) repeat protein